MGVVTREEIISALERVHREGDAFWNAFDLQSFFQCSGEKWSPAQTVRHLTKSTRPVAKALTTPRLLLRILFGSPRRPPVTYDELRTRYVGLLAEGGQAGRFAPSSQAESDLGAFRQKIMGDRATARDALIAGIRKWPEQALDRYQLPHPILGRIIVREMLLFTIYHHNHHAEVIRRRTQPASASM